MASGTSYNGWPANSNGALIGINPAWEPIPGHRFPGGIKSGDVEVVMTYVVQQLHARVERIDRDAIKDDWGYTFKYSANSPNLLSCHASGTAFDYNATRHPNKVRNTWTTVQVAEVRKIQAEAGGVVRWLYDSTNTPDEMHFEIEGTPAQVKVVADSLRNKPKELFTVDQYAEIMRRFDKIDQALLIGIAEGRELDDDIPENIGDKIGECQRLGRAIADKVGAVVAPPNP